MERRGEATRFHRLLALFLREHLPVRRKASDKTIRSYRQSIKQFAAWSREERGVRFDEMRFADLSRDAACAFLVWLRDERGLSPQTLNLRLSAIKAFLRFCGEEDVELAGLYLSVSSIRPFKGASSPGTEHLEPVQSGELFSEPDVSTRIGRRDRFLMTLAYESGTRMQELLDLTCDRVGECGGYVTLRVHGKGGKARIVPLASQAVEHLDAYMAEFHPGPDPEGWLLFTVHGGKRTKMSPGTVDHLLKKYAASIHARDPSFPEGLHAHTLRHSIATAMYRAGSPIPYTRDFLGHADPSTTMVYAHADGGAIASAVEAASRQVATPVTPAEKRWKGREQYLLELCGLA
ncbi:tyrosine-type recombinase/integrase [Olsenella uli]|uniref:tyrosine-type recombinase/integrase n=1 Tax=Olsenella uli TaxID=133926 RepID=UPI0028E595B7|nr:tyrosine-type recombinase/integrase [Olsenella uli]